MSRPDAKWRSRLEERRARKSALLASRSFRCAACRVRMTSLSFGSISSAPWRDLWKPSVRRCRLIFRLSDASRVWIGMTACLGLAIYSSSGSVP